MFGKIFNKKNSKKHWIVVNLPIILMIVAIIGFVASFVLTAEEIARYKDPGKQLACDINPLISCGSVMANSTPVLRVVPNPVIGLITFTMLGTIAFAMMAGATFKRWFWKSVQVGVALGVIFGHYLIWLSIFDIRALCLYCMLSWLAIIPMFLYVTLYNLAEGHIKLPKKYNKAVDFALKHHADILIGWYLVIAALVFYEFWYYWQTLI